MKKVGKSWHPLPKLTCMSNPKPTGRPRNVPSDNFEPRVLKMLRAARGLNQRQLAAKVGTSIPTASNWETGRAEPTEGQVEAIAEALECRPQDLGNLELLNVAKTLENPVTESQSQ